VEEQLTRRESTGDIRRPSTNYRGCMAALSGQSVECAPLIPHVGGYELASIPIRCQQMMRWELLAELGADLFIRSRRGFARWPPESFVPLSTMVPTALSPANMQSSPLKSVPDRSIESSNTCPEHESLVTAYNPVGTIRSLWRQRQSRRCGRWIILSMPLGKKPIRGLVSALM